MVMKCVLAARVVAIALAARAFVFALMLSAAVAAAADSTDAVTLGARIYNEGKLASGAPLEGRREGRAILGSEAACANCHRPSGLGQVEGDVQVPPIGGNFLFGKRGDQGITTMDPHVSKLFNQAHDPYTDDTLMRAIRDGINSLGRPMNVAMPRYALGATELAALSAYLRQLSTAWSPGVTASTIELATVVTPEVATARRRVFIEMMRAIVRQKNASTVVADPKKNRHHMVTAAELIHGTERNWNMQIWELQGAPETWREQLQQRYQQHPVFALVSGLSEASWQPIQDFCDSDRVPCWFPSAAATGAKPGTYTLYFSRGVRLEASLLAQGLMARYPRPRRVVQVHRDDELGRTAAVSLAEALAGSGIESVQRVVKGDAAAASLQAAIGTADANDAFMFWLSPEDIKMLVAIEPPRNDSYFSGLLARGEEAPLTAAWRARSRLVYPFELPAKRHMNLDYFHAWLNLSKVPLVDEPMQSETYFAMSFLTDTLSEMLDNLYRDYLIERAEQMLSKREGLKAEQEARDRIALGREGDLLRRRGPMTMDASTRIMPASGDRESAMSSGTTLYPHLSLAPGQRFASKSGYIVRFAQETGKELTAESPLMTP